MPGTPYHSARRWSPLPPPHSAWVHAWRACVACVRGVRACVVVQVVVVVCGGGVVVVVYGGGCGVWWWSCVHMHGCVRGVRVWCVCVCGGGRWCLGEVCGGVVEGGGRWWKVVEGGGWWWCLVVVFGGGGVVVAACGGGGACTCMRECVACVRGVHACVLRGWVVVFGGGVWWWSVGVEVGGVWWW